MTYLREQFPILRDTNYLDVAHKASVPNAVVDATREFYADVQATGGDKDRWNECVEDTRERVARLLNARPGQVAFQPNTSHGMNLLAHSMAFASGDNVVIGDQEHENNEFPWTHLSDRGLEVRRVESAGHRFEAGDVAALVDDRTRAVSLSHVYPASGFIPDLRAIGALCRERGAFLFVDAVQSLGAVPTDVADLHVDGLATSGHKWLLGPYGAGFLFVSERFLEAGRPAFAAKLYGRGDGAPYNTADAPDARRFELGSLNYAGIYGLRASLDMLESIGHATIGARVAELVDCLHDEARRAGLAVLDVRTPERGAGGIVSLVVDDAVSLAGALARERIQVSARRGLLRVSLHFYNAEDDVRSLIAAVRRLA